MHNKTHGETDEQVMAEVIKNEKIRRAMLAGAFVTTSEATVAEMDRNGVMAVLRSGTNDWVCVPGDQNVIAGTPYAHLHVCGSPWDGNEFHARDRGVWTMAYSRP